MIKWRVRSCDLCELSGCAGTHPDNLYSYCGKRGDSEYQRMIPCNEYVPRWRHVNASVGPPGRPQWAQWGSYDK